MNETIGGSIRVFVCTMDMCILGSGVRTNSSRLSENAIRKCYLHSAHSLCRQRVHPLSLEGRLRHEGQRLFRHLSQSSLSSGNSWQQANTDLEAGSLLLWIGSITGSSQTLIFTGSTTCPEGSLAGSTMSTISSGCWGITGRGQQALAWSQISEEAACEGSAWRFSLFWQSSGWSMNLTGISCIWYFFSKVSTQLKLRGLRQEFLMIAKIKFYNCRSLLDLDCCSGVLDEKALSTCAARDRRAMLSPDCRLDRNI